MVVDLVLILIVVLCIVWGYTRGGVLDILGLAALLAACLFSAPIAPLLARVFLAHTSWSAGVSYVVARLVAGLCIYIPLIVLAGFIDRRIGRSEEGVPHPWNRLLGAACGLATGLAFLFILLFLVDVGVKVFPDASGWPVESARGSVLRRCVSTFNPADRYLLTDGLRLVRAARQDPEVFGRLSKDPDVRRLLDAPALKALLEDKEFVAAARARNIGAVVSNEHFRRVLEDKELREIIVSPELHAALEKALAESSGVKRPEPAP